MVTITIIGIKLSFYPFLKQENPLDKYLTSIFQADQDKSTVASKCKSMKEI